jgi:hypothetical protein
MNGILPYSEVFELTALRNKYLVCSTVSSLPGIYINGQSLSITAENTTTGQYSLIVFQDQTSDFIKLRLTLPENAPVNLSVYSLVGQESTRISFGSLKAGNHDLIVENMPREPGVYLLSLQAGKQFLTRKVIRN